jgi:hypothetical protein
VKIEQLLVQHLYTNKNVTIQGIGTIHLNPSVVLPTEGDKDYQMPENAFSFEFNLKATEDDALIQFIVQQTRKIKPLASSDLESYSLLAKQFLNIGKPFVIEGVGTIFKSQTGAYEFNSGNLVTPKIEDAPKPLNEKTEEPIYPGEIERTTNNKRIWISILLVIIVSGGGLGLYYIYNKPIAAPTQVVTIDSSTLINDEAAADSSIQPVAPKPAADSSIIQDSFTFRVVIKEYKLKKNAEASFKNLTMAGHRLEFVETDSTHYKLVMPFTRPLTDTSYVKDSLQKFFLGNPYLYKKN